MCQKNVVHEELGTIKKRNQKFYFEFPFTCKAAVRVIMGQTYTGYGNGLKALNIETLDKRSDHLCLRFAKKCLKSEKLRNLFERNNPTYKMKKRNEPKSFKCKKIRTERYKKSSIPFMTNLMNKESEDKSLQIKESKEIDN